MNNIVCAAVRCIHNTSHRCQAGEISVSGGSCRQKEYTYCDTYMDGKGYVMASLVNQVVQQPIFSDINHRADGGGYSIIYCGVTTCAHQQSGKCGAQRIFVDAGSASFPTFCATFHVRMISASYYAADGGMT
ncbi:DUF1540 domain-containing protein [Clostridia bacterium OttesenSCG-928-F22]|nr:DUF1540 domain-containing protein [Clostridia bacterium OttesenSCG-928-F22]